MSRRTPGPRVPLLMRTAGRALAVLSLGAPGCRAPGTPARPPVASTPGAAVKWDYAVRLGPDGNLDVVADFAAFSGNLATVDGAEAFVEGVSVAAAGGEVASVRGGAEWTAACERGCRVRYRFRLAEAARQVRDVDVAIEAGGAYFAPPSTWLLRPSRYAGQGNYRFRVETEAGARFVTGVRPAPSGGENGYEASIASFDESSFAGFGALTVRALQESGLTIAVAPHIGVRADVLFDWAAREANAIDAYLGRAGDGRAVVFVVPGTSEATRGKTLGGGASAFIRLGSSVGDRNLYEDWVLAHEVVHIRFPGVFRRHAWFSEGLASYAEPVARVRAGLLDEKKMWSELVDGMPQGLPGPNDRGLDGNGEWGRVYWGGALFFLVADVEIRKATAGTRSLESALRAVVATGANVEVTWPLEQVLERGDGATGTHVLRDLYREMALAPGTVDLDQLWKRLGIRRAGTSVRFDDAAPEAAIRRGIAAEKASLAGGRRSSAEPPGQPPKSEN